MSPVVDVIVMNAEKATTNAMLQEIRASFAEEIRCCRSINHLAPAHEISHLSYRGR